GGGIVGNVNVGPAVVVVIGDAGSESVGGFGLGDASGAADVSERAVPVVTIEKVCSAFQSGDSVEDGRLLAHHGRVALVKRQSVFVGDVVTYEKVEAAIAVVVQEGGAGVPVILRFEESALAGHVRKRAVAVVVVEHVLAIVGDEEIEVTVVVVVADTDALSPSMANETGFLRDVGEGTVTIIFVEVVGGLFAFGEVGQPPTVDDEDVEPAVVVVIEERNAAPGCGQQE